MNYFDPSEEILSLSYCTESVRSLTTMVTPAWRILPLHKCAVIRAFSDNGTTRVEIRKPEMSFAPRCLLTCGNLPLHYKDVTRWHWGIEHQNVKYKLIQIRARCPCVPTTERKKLRHTKTSEEHNWHKQKCD